MMKRFFTRFLAALALLVCMTPSMVAWGQSRALKTYKLTIDAGSFNTTSYAANNNEKTTNAVNVNDNTDTYQVKWTSNQVMKNSSNMQWQKSNGYIYNSTDLGTITSVTVTKSAGSFTTYYGTTEQPSSGTTPGGGFFKTKVGSETGTTSKLEVTFQIQSYTITAQSNNTSCGTVSMTGNVITGSPKTNCRYATPAYTVSPANSATVTKSGNNFTVTASSDCTVTINFEAIPSHTATFSVNGETSSQEFIEGTTITFPANPADIDGKTFVGWTTNPIDGTTDEAPTMVNSATMGDSNVTFYAVFASVTPGTATTVTDVLTRATTGVTSGSTTYSNWSDKTSNSNAVYAGNSAGGNDAIQLRTKNSNSGVVTTASGGKAKKVTISWNDNTASDRTLDIYGKSSAYSEASDLYASTTQGTKLGSVTYGTSTELTITGDYDYIGMRSSNDPLYISSISIEWEEGTPDTYSGYCTTVGNTPASYINLVAYNPSYPNPYLAELYVGDTPESQVTWYQATVVCVNLQVADLEDFYIQFYDEQGGPIGKPDWIMSCEVVSKFSWMDYDIENILYVSAYANTGLERKTYFKVCANDANDEPVYSSLVTVIQAGVPQDLTVTLGTYVDAIYVFDANDQSDPLIANGEEGTVQVAKGTSIVVSPDVAEGFVLQTLIVGGEDVTSQIDETGAYTFDMPAEPVTITATAVVAPGDYVRITSLDQLKDGSKVIIAARYDSNSKHYSAMKSTSLSNGKAEGEEFTSTMSGTKEILPSEIANTDEGFYWTVSVTDYGYTFTNSNDQTISGSSSASFGFNGNNSYWDVDNYIANGSAMVSGYAGFKIVNADVTDRAFALNTSHNFGPYATSNMSNTTANQYNFSLDFFVQEEVELGSYDLSIDGYTDDEGRDGYYLIASPVTVNPKDVEGLTDGTFDLYCFDESQEDAEWRNYEATNGHFKLVPGKGYLYAKKIAGATNTYNFTLTGLQYEGDGVVELSYTEGKKWAGWNLIGNPYATNATIPDSRDYYVLNVSGSELIAGEDYVIGAKEGIFVKASAAGESVTFTQAAKGNSVQSSNLVLNLSNSNGIIDRAIVRFDECQGLEKFQLNPNHTKVFFTQGNKDYAVVSSANEGEMPVNFKAETRGTYTLNVNAGNVDVTYLHLIDNFTGANVDLLANPSYSFKANKGDNANRFRLVFKTNANVEDNTATETFAYFNGSEWVISNPSTGSGSATLQVIDMMGRVLRSEQINGNTAVNINETAGIYMLRLINGENVMVQKVVVR